MPEICWTNVCHLLTQSEGYRLRRVREKGVHEGMASVDLGKMKYHVIKGWGKLHD
jgi:hypothetical protein